MPALTLAALVAVIRRPPPPPCGIEDDHPTGLPCRDVASTPVGFHCPNCGPRLRHVCTAHAKNITATGATCGLCAEAGQPGVPVQPQPASKEDVS